MKNGLKVLCLLGLMNLTSCGSFDVAQEHHSIVKGDLASGSLVAELKDGKKCVSELGFFQTLYWNGFLDAWESAVEDNFDYIPEIDQKESRQYEEVLRYQIGCQFAKKNISEELIRKWADLIKARKNQPELILPEIKHVYQLAKTHLNF